MWAELPATLLSKLCAQIGGHASFSVAAVVASVNRHWGRSVKQFLRVRLPRWYIEAASTNTEPC